MKNKTSLITLLTSMSIAVVFSAILLWSVSSLYSKFKETNSSEMELMYVTQHKELIAQEVNRLIDRIAAARETARSEALTKLKNNVESAVRLTAYIHENFPASDRKSQVEKLATSFESIDKSGNLFIITKNGNILHHGSAPDLSGKNISSANDHSGFQTLVKNTFSDKEFTGEYENSVSGKKKLAYARYSPSTRILIGSDIYLDKIDQQVQAEILKMLDTERFGLNNFGYFWVQNTKHKMVFHIDRSLYNKDLSKLTGAKGEPISQNIVDLAKNDGSGFYEYHWALPGSMEIDKKMSYLSYISDWDWIVAAGFYFKDLSAQTTQLENLSKQLLKSTLSQITFIILIAFLLTVTVSLIIFKKIRHIESDQEKHINDLLQYKTVLDASSLVSITDVNGRITHVNDQFCNITGYPREKFIGNRHNIIRHPDTPQNIFAEMWKTIAKGEIWRGIMKNMTANGGYYYQKATIVPLKDISGNVEKYISISYDVTEVFENNTKLQKFLNTDSLTGLGNRASLIQEIKGNINSDIALVDIDQFHEINEAYSMKTGDKLLMEFAARLTSSPSLQYYDIYRLHSDVFAVYSPSSNTEEFVKNVENAMYAITKQVFTPDNHEIIILTRTGYAHGSAELLANADAALQFAKTNNLPHHTYDPLKLDKTEIYEKNTKVVRMISSAIEENRVVPYFQQIKGLKDDSLKYEALMRIIEPDGRVVPPSEFIEISKQTRYYLYLTRIIASKTIDMFEKTDASFSINISTQDINDLDTMEYIFNYAKDRNVLDKLILEIVESESLTASAGAAELLSRFKQSGTKIAIDDFGTGYSNFDYLLKIKADFIKIDGSIVKLLGKDERARDLVNSIVTYSRKLGMKTIAEFISDEQLYNVVKNMGVDFVQGYYVGKPSPQIASDYQKR
jgi:PAS domain S-box-containing protein/diguanylate cyclase (GGDEF)-like protein